MKTREIKTRQVELYEIDKPVEYKLNAMSDYYCKIMGGKFKPSVQFSITTYLEHTGIKRRM
jgi:hypothetical protein